MYESEEDEKQNAKMPDKKEPPKKPTENDVKELNKLIIKKEAGVNRELFQKHFNFLMPIIMLKTLYRADSKKKTDELVKELKVD